MILQRVAGSVAVTLVCSACASNDCATISCLKRQEQMSLYKQCRQEVLEGNVPALQAGIYDSYQIAVMCHEWARDAVD